MLFQDNNPNRIKRISPTKINQSPICDMSLKKIHIIKPKTMESNPLSNTPCFTDLMFCFILEASLKKLNLVDSIEGLFSLLSPPS